MPLSVLLVLGIFAIFLIVRSRAPGASNSTTIDPDGEIFRALERSGADLTRAHQLEFFLYFDSEAGARATAAALTSEGYRAEVSQEQDGNWLCLAEQSLVPQLERIRQIGSHLTAVAEANQGGYDGWGVTVDDATT